VFGGCVSRRDGENRSARKRAAREKDAADKLARLSTSLMTLLIEFAANCILESPISGGRLQSAVQ
jgi:hypothetical protein